MTLGLLKVAGANTTTAFLKVHHDQLEDPPVLSRCSILCASIGCTRGARARHSHCTGRCDGNAQETRSQKACNEETLQSQRCQKGDASSDCRETGEWMTERAGNSQPSFAPVPSALQNGRTKSGDIGELNRRESMQQNPANAYKTSANFDFASRINDLRPLASVARQARRANSMKADSPGVLITPGCSASSQPGSLPACRSI